MMPPLLTCCRRRSCAALAMVGRCCLPLCLLNLPGLLTLLLKQAAKMANGSDSGDRKATFARNLAALNSQFAT